MVVNIASIESDLTGVKTVELELSGGDCRNDCVRATIVSLITTNKATVREQQI